MTMGEIQTSGGGIAARNAHMSNIIINAVDGRHLMTIDLEKGTVTGELADVSEAGSRFMDYLNQQIGPLARNRITDLETENQKLIANGKRLAADVDKFESWWREQRNEKFKVEAAQGNAEAHNRNYLRVIKGLENRIAELEEVIRKSAFREGSTEGALEEARAEITKLNRLLSSKLADTEAAEAQRRLVSDELYETEAQWVTDKLRAETVEAELENANITIGALRATESTLRTELDATYVIVHNVREDRHQIYRHAASAEVRIEKAMAAVMAATDPADYGPALEAVGRALTEVPE